MSIIKNIGWETIAGVAIGIGVVGYLWSQNNEKDDDVEVIEGVSKKKKFLRDFQVQDLARYDGSGDPPRPMFIAVDCVVYDVTPSIDRSKGVGSSKYSQYAGKAASSDKVDVAELKKNYVEVGRLIIQREYTVDEIYRCDGRDGRPIYIAAKGSVYDVTLGRDYYGPDEAYGIMAGRDASRALALVSLDQKDVDNTRLDDLSNVDIYTLDEWCAKFEFKYTKLGTLAGWSMAGSPMPTEMIKKINITPQTQSTSEPRASLSASNGNDLDAYKKSPTWLSKDRKKIALSEKIQLSSDTYIFRFAFPDKNMRLGLPIGKHIKLWCPNPKPVKEGEWNGRPDPENGHEIERKYTPSSLDANALGYFDVVIKVYKPNEKFCDGGKMSQFVGNLKIGDTIDVAGPFGLIEYQGRGNFFHKKQVHHYKYLGMIAGGTGVTPMLQLIQAVLRDPKDETKISLLFANQTESDILCRDMLEKLATENPTRFKIHYTLDSPPENWKYSSCFISEKMIRENLPPPSPSTAILLCGPPPMIKFACKPNLEKVGYPAEETMEF